jgi:2'-5' RNA ligase
MGPLRLFVALDLPPDVRDVLAAVGAAADAEVWRAVKPETLHVTLAFLGARPPGDVAAIDPIVAAEDGGPAPRLEIERVLGLPPRRARVLTVALDDPDGTLGALQARLSAALEQAGLYTPETRPFRPHITVARLRSRQRAPRATPDVETRGFHGTAVTVYRSTTHPTGARYEPLARASLR